jgi:ABC-2 type transport system ATP-binding protein
MIKVENLTKYYGDLCALDNINFEVKKGEILGLLFVFDYLNYVADIKHVEKKKKISHIQELAELCSLNEVMHMTIAELSKGYRQRVGIAHALMGDPEILIFDEPTSGLDPNQIAETREIIKRIGKKKTIVFSTHILSEAEATCDRIVILDEGKIVADDRLKDLRESLNIESFEDIFRKITKGNCK